MAQIEKPSAAGTVEGFDELNSTCDVAQLTTILRVCGQRKKPFYSFAFTTDPGKGARSSRLFHCSPESEKGRLR